MSAIRGFLFVPRARPGPLLEAAPGDTVAQPSRAPPWIVVDHQLARVLVTSWPGRLLFAEVTDPVTAEDQTLAGQPGLRPDAGYTRAVGVRVLEQRDPSSLFGPHGAAVVEIIEAARTLSLEAAHALVAEDDPDAARCYSEAWDAWLHAEDRGTSIHLGHDHAGTLAIPARNRSGAPIHQGFSVIASELRKRARAVSGDAAIVVDEEGEAILQPPWSGATRALLHAAMATGAPELAGAEDRARLLRAWTARAR